MLPRKLHLEQINRFHDTLEKLDKEIENEKDPVKQYKLLKKFMTLTKFWSEIDDFVEFKIKQKLDEIE